MSHCVKGLKGSFGNSLNHLWLGRFLSSWTNPVLFFFCSLSWWDLLWFAAAPLNFQHSCGCFLFSFKLALLHSCPCFEENLISCFICSYQKARVATSTWSGALFFYYWTLRPQRRQHTFSNLFTESWRLPNIARWSKADCYIFLIHFERAVWIEEALGHFLFCFDERYGIEEMMRTYRRWLWEGRGGETKMTCLQRVFQMEGAREKEALGEGERKIEPLFFDGGSVDELCWDLEREQLLIDTEGNNKKNM